MSCFMMTDIVFLCHALRHFVSWHHFYCDVMPSWPHLSHDIIECFSLLKLYFNFNFFLLSPFYYIQLPFISNFLLYAPSFYILLPFICSFLVYSTSSFDNLSHFVSKTFGYDVFLVDCNPRLYSCSPFNLME